jgi:hypothetical protein
MPEKTGVAAGFSLCEKANLTTDDMDFQIQKIPC